MEDKRVKMVKVGEERRGKKKEGRGGALSYNYAPPSPAVRGRGSSK